MARENISYAKCNCDICGKEEHISQSLILPKGWNEIKIDGAKLELCEKCNEKIKNYVSGWIRNRRVP